VRPERSCGGNKGGRDVPEAGVPPARAENGTPQRGHRKTSGVGTRRQRTSPPSRRMGARASTLPESRKRPPSVGAQSAGQAETSRVSGRLVTHDLGSLRDSEPKVIPSATADGRTEAHLLPFDGGSAPQIARTAPAPAVEKENHPGSGRLRGRRDRFPEWTSTTSLASLPRSMPPRM
jgi:hypothetical protein